MSKLLSGRWIFTVITALVFFWASLSKTLTSEQILSIVMLVIGFYFNRPDRGKDVPKTT